MRWTPSLLSCVCLTVPTLAQSAAPRADEILRIERAADRAGRDRVAKLFASQRVTLRGKEMPAKRLASILTTASGDKVNFAVVAKAGADEIEPITLDLANVSMLSVLDAVQRTSDLRFVYRGGLVTLKPEDEMRELTVLRIYDLTAATSELRDKPGPTLKLRPPSEEVEEVDPDVDTGKTLSGLTIEKVQELVESNVDPESWDKAGTSIHARRGVLMVRQTERNQAAVAKLLTKLGVIGSPRPKARVRKVPVRKPAPERRAKAKTTSTPKPGRR